MVEIVAFDYDRQEWKTGFEAAALRLQQCSEELFLLNDPKYLTMMGLKDSDGDRHRARLKAMMAEAERYLHSGRR